MSKTFFIFEPETGLVDGYYNVDFPEMGSPADLRAFWDQERPAFTHVVCYAFGELGVLSENIRMADGGPASRLDGPRAVT